MHLVEDTTSWVSAKTVWKFMQMRALGIVSNTGTKSIFRTLPYILHVRPLLAQNSCNHANDVPPDFFNVLLNLCQNCKMHFVEDVIGWWTRKTVRNFMQMRAQENFRKTTCTGWYLRVPTRVGLKFTHSFAQWVKPLAYPIYTWYSRSTGRSS